MNQTIKDLKDRRSIRKYKKDPVPQEMIDDILEAARLAPSGNNKQPWKFMIVKDTKKLDGLFYQDFVLEAPVIIVCACDPTVYQKVEGWDSENDVRAIRDLSIATSQMVLQATELGLGTCYVGWVKKEESTY